MFTAVFRKRYRHTATLTITKKLQTASGEAQTDTKTFYAGIYRKKDFSDTPTVVALNLKNASEASAKRRILLSSSNEVNYYIAEVDKSGKRITDEASFGYTIQVDQPEVTLKGGEEKHVTITNKTRVSKVTLYLTKKVYEGTSKKAVNETFYAGLFKDPEFTQLYAKPIALQLKNKSEITLKLSLNLGAAAGAQDLMWQRSMRTARSCRPERNSAMTSVSSMRLQSSRRSRQRYSQFF